MNDQKNSFAALFTPKLITCLREGYDLKRLGKDALAGLTVAIVALPLSMGIAIASGVGPERGLFTAIIAGFLISMLGGSRYQIGGPTAAFIVVVYRTIEHHGYDGLALATLLAGLMLVAIGLLRLGTYIKYIPYPVTIGFTAGIGVTILVGQLADLLGLKTGKLPGEFIPKVEALVGAMPTFNVAALALSALGLAIILLLQKFRPNWPRFLIMVVLVSVAVAFLPFDVVTIGKKFGDIPAMLPAPQLPALSLEKIRAVMPDAITIALLAAIESLLSAVVADGMTGRQHRSNIELVAQGVANIFSPLFGGLSATGAIARTATNIRSGGTSPVAGMLHALFILAFMVVAAPLARYVPLCALSVILMIVAWNMSEVGTVKNFLVNASEGDRLLLLSTLLLTVFTDLTLAIEVGVVLGAFKFMHNMSQAVEVESHMHLLEEDKPDVVRPARGEMDFPAMPRDTALYRIHGPFFFGAASELAKELGSVRFGIAHLVLDFEDVPLLDATGATTLKGLIASAAKKNIQVTLVGLSRRVRNSMKRFKIEPPRHVFFMADNVEEALKNRLA